MKKPFPFQQAQIEHMVQAPGPRWLAGDEMGAGKTLQLVRACRELDADRIVVICPAVARGGWRREFADWWPERFSDPDSVGVIDMTPSRKTQTKKKRASWEDVLSRNVRIVSPELFQADRERQFLDGGKRPALLLDEVHMYAEPKAGRSKKVRKALKKFRGTVFAATATPVPNRPIGMWNSFDMIWPRRLGAGVGTKVNYQFAHRYVAREYNEYGSVPMGLNPEFEGELRERLKYMMSRTTRAEVQHLFPPCQLRALTPDITANLEDTTKEWVENALEEATHVVVLTHRRAAARSLADVCEDSVGGGVPVVHVDGATPPTQRMERLDWLRAQPKGVLVSTMHAVARSISLSWCTRGLLAELYWSPEKLVQVIGRFARLDSTASAIVDIMCGANTVQERIAYSVSDKLWDNKKLMSEGATESGLSTVLSGTEEDFEKALLDAAYCVASDEEMEALDALGGEV